MKFLSAKIAFLTKHHKLAQVAPVFAQVWSGEIVLVDDFDTDSLGSFDQHIARQLRADECAIKKAQLACELSGLDQGIGSEGSFNAYAGMGNLNEEIIAFVDRRKHIEVLGVYRQMVSLQPINADDEATLEKALLAHDPAQAWMILDANGKAVKKGLRGKTKILEAAQKRYPVALSPDFRAMHCPQRQDTIVKATQNLLHRLQSVCPQCEYPDFVADKKLRGLPCEICLSPTSQVKLTCAECKRCGYETQTPSEQKTASSFYCEFCNP